MLELSLSSKLDWGSYTVSIGETNPKEIFASVIITFWVTEKVEVNLWLFQAGKAEITS